MKATKKLENTVIVKRKLNEIHRTKKALELKRRKAILLNA